MKENLPFKKEIKINVYIKCILLFNVYIKSGQQIFGAIMAKKGRPEMGKDGRNKSVIFRLSQNELDALKEISGTKKIPAFCRDIILSIINYQIEIKKRSQGAQKNNLTERV